MRVDRQYIEDAKALLRKMVAVPSPSFSEGAVCDLISAQLDDWGINSVREGNNIIAICPWFNPSLKTLAMDAHLDTVPASSSYTRDPFEAGNEEDTIFGLGANDDGGSVVSMIAAFRIFYSEPLPFNLMLCLCCEEERSGPGGAKWLYAEDGFLSQSPNLPMPEWVIVGEPTCMRAATSERGLLVLDCEAHGVCGHAARNEGVNALYLALEDIEKMRGHKFSRLSEEMGEVHLNVTQIEAGSAHNVVPDSCQFVVDIRPTDSYANEEIVQELKEICKSDIKPRNLANKSSATAANSALRKTAATLGIETFSSPTTSDWMRIGVDAIKMGPGDSARSHKADEYIKCSEIEEAIEKYTKFIINFYGNTLE